jgi:class 3 adenylate cyclase
MAAHEGLLELRWDLLCPVCRISSELLATLRAARDHGHCQACNLDYPLDFGASFELIFRVHPRIRAVDTGVYCIGGPSHSPHVAAQLRLAPGERFELELALPPGQYRLRGPTLPFTRLVRVHDAAATARIDLHLRPDDPAGAALELRPGRQRITLTHGFAGELLVRLERTAGREDVVTAARAACLPLFRELFPSEILAPGRLVSVSSVALLVTAVDGALEMVDTLGEARTFALLHDHLRRLADRIEAEGGAVVKLLDHGLMACFPDPVHAVRAGLALGSAASASAAPVPAAPASAGPVFGGAAASATPGPASAGPVFGGAAAPAPPAYASAGPVFGGAAASATPGPASAGPSAPDLADRLKAAVHCGPAMAITLNDRLDYFGHTPLVATRLVEAARAGELALSEVVALDPGVAALLLQSGRRGRLGEGPDRRPIQRLELVQAAVHS